MASYHCQVKSVSRGQGRSAVAAAAYRASARLECAREGRVHDYTRKRGVEAAFVVAPEGAPDWASDRERLWNAAEEAERRKNSVVAREWEVALPHELGPEQRRGVVVDFAQALAERYGVAADVAIHAPHAQGDQRNHHAHVLTTTRAMGEDGLGAKTRVLDAQASRGAEVTAMRALWAELQNAALERAEKERGLEARALDRVDHRSLAAQREAALAAGDEVRAEALDRPAEVKLGPAASAMERRAEREAEARGVPYEPVTDRGAQVHEARRARALLAEMRAGLEAAREKARELGAGAWEAAQEAREAGRGAWASGWSALRGAAARLWGGDAAMQSSSHVAEERSSQAASQPVSQAASQEIGDAADRHGGRERGAEERPADPLRLGAELRVAGAEPLAVPGPEERAGLMARWRELPASEAREGFVERRAVEWRAMGRHEDPEIAEAGQRPVIREVEEAAPRFEVEPEMLLAAVVERSEAIQRMSREADERRERQREAERAWEQRREQERAQRLREERESVERVRRIVEGKRAREREREAARLRAAEAALGERLPRAAAVLGEPEERLADTVAERADVLRREREAGAPEGAERERRAQEAARGPFVEANARAWDAALWAEERETAQTGYGRAPGEEPEPGSALAKEREQLRTRIEHGAIRFKEPEGALRGAIQARAEALDEEHRPERAAEVARLEAERVAEQDRLSRSVSLPGLAAAVREGRELSAEEREVVEAGLEPTLRRVVGDDGLARLHLGDHRALGGVLPDEGDQLAVAWAQLEGRHARTDSGLAGRWAGAMERRLEAWEAREAERARAREAEEERRREAEREAERARSCEALAELAAGLRSTSWGQMGEAAKERLRVGLGQHLERAVGPEGVDRLDRGDHAALEGVLDSAEDRVRLTQLRLLDHGALFRDEEMTARGRGLYGDLVDAQMAEERALGRGRDRDMDDDLGL